MNHTTKRSDQKQLSKDEQKLVSLLRRVRAEQQRQPVPRRFLGHGALTQREAAKVLDLTLKELKARGEPGHFGRGRICAWVASKGPNAGRAVIPYSEVRREFARRHKSMVDGLIRKAANLVSGEAAGSFSFSLAACLGPIPYDHPGYDHFIVPAVAERLGVTDSYVEELIESDGPRTLFARRDRKGRRYVSGEEIAAFKRTWGKTLKPRPAQAKKARAA